MSIISIISGEWKKTNNAWNADNILTFVYMFIHVSFLQLTCKY